MMPNFTLSFDELRLLPNASILASGHAEIRWSYDDSEVEAIFIDTVHGRDYVELPRESPLWPIVHAALLDQYAMEIREAGRAALAEEREYAGQLRAEMEREDRILTLA